MKGAKSEKKPEKKKGKHFSQACSKCGYAWQSRTKDPKSCPKCKRYDWKK